MITVLLPQYSHGTIASVYGRILCTMNNKRSLIKLAYRVLTVLLCGIFALGVISFIIVPPQAKAEAAAIEEMLRKKQEEEEERIRKAREEQLRKQKEEYEAHKNIYDLQDEYDDASQMRVTGIGDSVMLAALDELYEVFPNGYFDAVFGRTIYEGMQTLYDLEANNALGDVIIFSLGANSYIEEEDIEELIAHSGGRPTFFLTTVGVTNDSNEKTRNIVAKHDDASMIEWEELALQHLNEYILADGLHPNHEGSMAYAELIRETINQEILVKWKRSYDPEEDENQGS